MQGQIWVTIGVCLMGAAGQTCVLPVRSRLVPSTGNRSKLKIAQALNEDDLWSYRTLLPFQRTRLLRVAESFR